LPPLVWMCSRTSLKLNPELLKCSNIVMTPHIGSGTLATRLAMANLASDNLIAFLHRGQSHHASQP
jgi:glyoxylate/hydroxypyruvate/2-ketogluconate reductase